MKEKKSFYTEEFYNNPQLTIDVLNDLIEKKCVADMDMHKSGTFLFMEVFNNQKSKDILSKVISNFDEYKEYNNKSFVSDGTTGIGMCALQDSHTAIFGKKRKEIKYDAHLGEFVFEEDQIHYY